jgi:hypothetical protein
VAIVKLDISTMPNLRLVENVEDMTELERSTRHYISKPSSYPALFFGRMWDDPNGPCDIEWIEISEGSNFEIIGDEANDD